MAKSILQNSKRCYVCGSTMVHKHHVFNGANRTKSEKEGLYIYLCPFHHNTGGQECIHENQVFDLSVKQFAQKKYEELNGHDKFMYLFRKNYL